MCQGCIKRKQLGKAGQALVMWMKFLAMQLVPCLSGCYTFAVDETSKCLNDSSRALAMKLGVNTLLASGHLASFGSLLFVCGQHLVQAAGFDKSISSFQFSQPGPREC